MPGLNFSKESKGLRSVLILYLTIHVVAWYLVIINREKSEGRKGKTDKGLRLKGRRGVLEIDKDRKKKLRGGEKKGKRRL